MGQFPPGQSQQKPLCPFHPPLPCGRLCWGCCSRGGHRSRSPERPFSAPTPIPSPGLNPLRRGLGQAQTKSSLGSAQGAGGAPGAPGPAVTHMGSPWHPTPLTLHLITVQVLAQNFTKLLFWFVFFPFLKGILRLSTFSYTKLALMRSKINRVTRHKNQVFIRRDPTKRFMENNAFNT